MPNRILHQAWLRGLATLIRQSILPEYNEDTVAAYGFPDGRDADDTRGTCYFPPAPRPPVIFIHPDEWKDSASVIRTFIHEAIHSVLPAGCGHGQEFHARAELIGLDGALRDEPNAELSAWIQGAIAALPPMPSDPLGRKPKKERKARAEPGYCLMVCTCRVRIRCAPSVLAQCLRCNSPFKRLSKEET